MIEENNSTAPAFTFLRQKTALAGRSPSLVAFSLKNEDHTLRRPSPPTSHRHTQGEKEKRRWEHSVDTRQTLWTLVEAHSTKRKRVHEKWEAAEQSTTRYGV